MWKKCLLIGGGLGCLAWPAWPANDFPTEARVEYVFACMAVHGETPESLRQCSCGIDTIASFMSHREYVDAETVQRMRMIPTGGEKTSLFRETAWAKKIMEKLMVAQAEAELECF